MAKCYLPPVKNAPSLWQDLKGRRVFRALIAWGVAAFAILQIIEPVMHAWHWPDAVLTWVVALLAVGFPLVGGLAWVLDADGGTRDAGPVRPRLALLLVAVGVAAPAPGLIWYFGFRGRSAAAVGPSIAVLPLADMSAQKDQEYFGDGLAEELLNLLAQVPGLHVAGRTSSFAFKGKSDDLRTIGEKLNVATILEGSVRKEGDRIRINTQLINAADGYHLWSESYDRRVTDLFAVQDEIATAVVTALRVRLLPTQTHGQSRTTNVEAHNQYLLGRQFSNQGNADGYRRAEEAFEKTLALDSGYAPAWAALAQMEAHSGDYAGSSAEVARMQDRALEAAEKAVALAPDLAEARLARGTLRAIVQRDFDGARADLTRALALNPENPETLRGVVTWTLLPLGKLKEATAILRKVIAIDPINAEGWTLLGSALRDSGQFGLAREALVRALEIAPGADFSAMALCAVDLLTAQPAQALARSMGVGTVAGLYCTALAQHGLGHEPEATAALEAMIAQYGQGWAYQVAQIYAWQGARDRAFEWLDRAYAQRDPGLFEIRDHLLLQSLRADPRFAALLRKLKLE